MSYYEQLQDLVHPRVRIRVGLSHWARFALE